MSDLSSPKLGLLLYLIRTFTSEQKSCEAEETDFFFLSTFQFDIGMLVTIIKASK